MKQTLPWNITGIPSEAREAARAAASREGVTVGDWLTRRILAEQCAMAAVGARTGPDEAGTDSSQRIVRADPGPDAGIRRNDEMFRTMARRLESLERTQTDAQRVLNETATEIKTAAGVQAESFQQLAERLDRLERESDAGATRDAVRGLHQGLSRLADQIAHTTDGMTGQIAALAQDVADARDGSMQVGPAVEARFASLEERLGLAEGQINAAQFEETAARLEQRMSAGECRMEELLDRHSEFVRQSVEAISAQLDRAESRALSESDDLRASLAALMRRIETAEHESRQELRALRATLAELATRDEQPVSDVTDPEPIAVLELESSQGDEEPPEARSLPAFDFPITNVSPETPQDFALPKSFDMELPADADLLGQDLLADEESTDLRGDDFSIRRTGPIGRKVAARLMIALLIAFAVAAGFLLTRTFAGGNRVATAPGTSSAPGFQTVFDPFLKLPEIVESARPAPPSAIPSSARAGREPSAADVPAKAPEIRVSLQRVKQLADAGDPKAALALGLAYADGAAIEPNESAAAQWLRKAAQAGEPVAQYRLGTLYEKGIGVTADLKQAAKWYAEAAKGGNRKAMHNLAVAYANGAGVDKNYPEAARWFKAAADLGLVDSQFNLAVLYERGLGMAASLTDAYKWYAIAAVSGDMESQARVEALAAQLQPREKTAADTAVKAFRTKAMNRAANDPPELTQIAAQ